VHCGCCRFSLVPLGQGPNWLSDIAPWLQKQPYTLPVGNGRSYGDSCLLDGYSVLQTTKLNRLIHFDRETGVIKCESGVLLSDLLPLIVPQGWFLPVTPGTSFITLGGAVANDVHGKNHHCDGTFGRFVRQIDLLRSDGSLIHCSLSDNADLFAATIGGLGLTGVITTVEIQLMPITSSYLDVRYDAFSSLDEYATLSTASMKDHRYNVAWMDCTTPYTAGRGVLMSANHAAPLLENANQTNVGSKASSTELLTGDLTPTLSIPFNCPKHLLNRYSLRAFNTLYYNRQKRKVDKAVRQHYQPYFYPLDAIGHWNRIYGSNGFHQYQFTVPNEALTVMSDCLNQIVDSGMGSFLAVLKEFGDMPSPGLLSFPRKGYCLALDFAERGDKTIALIKKLDAQVREAGGAAYPAKDKLMSAQSFQQYFPQWEAFSHHIDPKLSSDFWQRVSTPSNPSTTPLD